MQTSNSNPQLDDSITTTTSVISGNSGNTILSPQYGGTRYSSHPTSFVNILNLAKSSLEANGVVQPEAIIIDLPHIRERFRVAPSPYADFAQSAQAISDLGFERATDVLSDFAKTLYPLYPCVDLSFARNHLAYVFIDSVSHIEDDAPGSDPISVSLAGLDILKAILGTTMLVTGSKNEPLALHLPRYLDWSCGRVITGNGPEIHDIVMAMLLVRQSAERPSSPNNSHLRAYITFIVPSL
jgi:hypothetical protein